MGSLDETVSLLALLGDSTRVRLLALLAQDQLTVTELVTITELGQSRVSTHLGRLKEAGLLRDRRVGAQVFYGLSESMPKPAAKLWQAAQQELEDGVLEADRFRAEQLRQAREQLLSWPDSIAGEMERHYSPGRTWEATARGLMGLVQVGDVLDVGSGDGAMAELLAPRARSITCLDVSERLIEAARARLSSLPNVAFRVGDMHELPFEDESFDQLLHLNTLTYAHTPAQALAESARVLRPAGTLALITLAAHGHTEVTAAYGHLSPGFSPAELSDMLDAAGLEVSQCEVTSRERRKPHFEVITAHARKPKP